jgi:hypothetical protein
MRAKPRRDNSGLVGKPEGGKVGMPLSDLGEPQLVPIFSSAVLTHLIDADGPIRHSASSGPLTLAD